MQLLSRAATRLGCTMRFNVLLVLLILATLCLVQAQGTEHSKRSAGGWLWAHNKDKMRVNTAFLLLRSCLWPRCLLAAPVSTNLFVSIASELHWTLSMLYKDCWPWIVPWDALEVWSISLLWPLLSWSFSLDWWLLSEDCGEAWQESSETSSEVQAAGAGRGLQHPSCDVSTRAKTVKTLTSYLSIIAIKPCLLPFSCSFTMKRGREYCTNPKDGWVQALMKAVDQKQTHNQKKDPKVICWSVFGLRLSIWIQMIIPISNRSLLFSTDPQFTFLWLRDDCTRQSSFQRLQKRIDKQRSVSYRRAVEELPSISCCLTFAFPLHPKDQSLQYFHSCMKRPEAGRPPHHTRVRSIAWLL